MAGSQINVTDVERKFAQLAVSLRGVALAVLGWLQETIQRSFETESTPEGVKWPQLSPQYAARKGARTGTMFARRIGPGGAPGPAETLNVKNMLYLSGNLFSGFATIQSAGFSMEFTGDVARITASSALSYAAAHQFGYPPRNLPQRSYLPQPATAEREAGRIVDDIIEDEIDRLGLN